MVYVDDILITGSNTGLINHFVSKLNTTFALKVLGPLTYLLCVELQCTPSGIHLSQAAYVNKLLQCTNMVDCKSSLSPASIMIQLSQNVRQPFPDASLYRSTIGTLQYLTITRPEISFIVGKLSQFMHKPTIIHWFACKQVLCI